MIRGIEDLANYLDTFHRSWSTSPGLDPSMVPVDLPDALAHLYRELGGLIALEPGPENDFRAPFHAQDQLASLEELKRVEGMLEFAWENQGNWSCRCPVGPGDPPVFSDAADLWDETTSGFQQVCASLAHFLVTMCLQEAVMSAPRLLQLPEDTPPADGLITPVTPLWLEGQYVFGEATHDFFEIPGEDVLIMRHGGLWVASHSDSGASRVKPGVRCHRIH